MPTDAQKSHLTRGAWIEMLTAVHPIITDKVAPHTRCVDWNRYNDAPILNADGRTSHEVRGLKYAYRNSFLSLMRRTSHEVRGLKCKQAGISLCGLGSHLTRGAWIEIATLDEIVDKLDVAPHTRCVDWNGNLYGRQRAYIRSHLTRGAWIEIVLASLKLVLSSVAPHTRCVDWNEIKLIIIVVF